MSRLDPIPFPLKDGRTLVFRHCGPDNAPSHPAFQASRARETTHTLNSGGPLPQVGRNGPSPHALRIGAFDGPRICAIWIFRPEDPSHPWLRHNSIFGMRALRELWGQGVGRKLLELMEAHARASGFKRIEATARTAKDRGGALYRRAGFEIEGTRRCAAYINESFQDEYFIAKLLL